MAFCISCMSPSGGGNGLFDSFEKALFGVIIINVVAYFLFTKILKLQSLQSGIILIALGIVLFAISRTGTYTQAEENGRLFFTISGITLFILGGMFVAEGMKKNKE